MCSMLQAPRLTPLQKGLPIAHCRPCHRIRCAPVAAKRHGGQEPEHQENMIEESDFDRETARLTVRMLTARAAGLVLQNVAQVDDFKAKWLQEHFTKNPPIEGNAFLAQMFEAKPVYSVDPYTGQKFHINPAQIASAVLATREVLAQKLAKSLGSKVQDANIDIMRTHLERHTYVSGTSNETKPSYRHYRKRKQQHQRMV